jgi:class 3 adenylate cyclase
MKRFTQAFEDPALEREYLASRTRRFSTFAIAAAIHGFLLWPIVGLVGTLLFPDQASIIVLSVLLGEVLLLAPVPVPLLFPLRLRDAAIRISAPVAVTGAMAFPLIDAVYIGDRAMAYTCLTVIVTIPMFYTGIGLRFVHGTALTFVVCAAYLTALALGGAERVTLAHASIWLLCAQVYGMQQGFAEERSRRRAFLAKRTISEERAKSERLLRNMLPEPIAERLKADSGAIADGHDGVTVLFADIVGFTPFSAKMSPRELVHLLNEVFSAFDALAGRHGLEKIKTIGDAYMVVGGLPSPRHDHAAAVAAMALDMQATVAARGEGLALRIGLHTGPVVAGVIGTAKYSYDLWGDTVNTASRMESHGAPGRIHVSDELRAALGEGWQLENRGVVEIKGKGPMKTHWLSGRISGACSA